MTHKPENRGSIPATKNVRALFDSGIQAGLYSSLGRLFRDSRSFQPSRTVRLSVAAATPMTGLHRSRATAVRARFSPANRAANNFAASVCPSHASPNFLRFLSRYAEDPDLLVAKTRLISNCPPADTFVVTEIPSV